jgi:hypothetical protein
MASSLVVDARMDPSMPTGKIEPATILLLARRLTDV